jgi:hypothetical protein
MNSFPSPKWTHRLAAFALVLSPACSTPTAGPEATPPAPRAPAPDPSSPAAEAQAARPAEPDRIAIRAQLAEHRAEQIAHLHAYGEKRRFPDHTTPASSVHIFRDPQGRLCAVANLIDTDGRHDLVEATVRDNNALSIADVHGGPVMKWIVTSGLTQEELVRIQVWPAFSPPEARKLAHKPAMAEERMNVLVVKHIVEMELELKANTEKSLDLAVERYLAAYPSGSIAER